MTLRWVPLSCSLQLHFGASPTIAVGDTYSGTSVIRYGRVPVPSESDGSADGLCFHAATKAAGGRRPLAISHYRLARLKPSSPLAIASVIALDEADGSRKGSGEAEASQKAAGKARSHCQRARQAGERDPASHATVEGGAKRVLFDGADDARRFPDGTEVELTITFTGCVQDGKQGGIYLASARSDGNDGNGSGAGAMPLPLLTHFEVSLARWAFPCPDDPAYRIDWTLQSLQLPACYGAGTVLANGSEVTRRTVRGQGGEQVQLGYSTVGPLPAYVLAFAAYPSREEPLLSVDAELALLPASQLADPAGADGSETTGPCCIPVSVLADGCGTGITHETLQGVLDALLFSIRYFSDFFQCPLPLCGCDRFRLLLAPMVPFLSGMENHCCVFLNEDIFADKAAGAKAGDAVARVELIAHEVAHHWVGNRVGFSFPVKEGICQVLEQQAADAFLGRPVRKLVALHDSTGVTATTAAARTDEPPQPPTSKRRGAERGQRPVTGDASRSRMAETAKGKEFTGHSYQQALAQMQNLIGRCGIPAFQESMQRVMRKEVTEVALEEEAHGGREAMRHAGVRRRQPPCFSTEDFIKLLSPPL